MTGVVRRASRLWSAVTLVMLASATFGCSRAAEATDVGACYPQPPRPLESAETVDCDDGRFQLVAWEDLPLGELEGWPGVRQLATLTYDLCGAALQARTEGTADPALEVWFDHPDEASWRAGDRRATCAVTRVDGRPLGGSALEGGR